MAKDIFNNLPLLKQHLLLIVDYVSKGSFYFGPGLRKQSTRYEYSDQVFISTMSDRRFKKVCQSVYVKKTLYVNYKLYFTGYNIRYTKDVYFYVFVFDDYLYIDSNKPLIESYQHLHDIVKSFYSSQKFKKFAKSKHNGKR